LWIVDLKRGENRLIIEIEQEFSCLAFSKNAQFLAAGIENIVKVWELNSCKPVHESQFNFNIQAVALKSDGSEILVTNAQPMTAHLRPVSTEALLREAHKYIGRSITRAEWKKYLPDRPFPPESKE
jgi:WD40 repeat protein